MRKVRVPALLAILLLPLVAAANTAPARVKTNVLTNRFAPSGNKAFYNIKSPATPKLPAGIKARPLTSDSNGCSDSSATNVRANQECTNQSAAGYYGRGSSQNETAAAVDPTNPHNLLLGQNDYMFGDGKCGIDYSTDGGHHWGSRLLPMNFSPGFVAARHYWTSSGDPSVAFDSTGEAYMLCGAFDRGGLVQDISACPDAAQCGSGLFLFRSADHGASWSFTGSLIVQSDGSGADGIGLLDKQYMAIDTSPTSPHKDRIYVTWSQFSPEFSASPITLAYSDDHGNSWHQTGTISGFDTTLCPINFSGAAAGTCDANQDSDPFTAPNGDVYVAFTDFNNCSGSLRIFGFHCPGNPNDNHNQILIVKSTNGGNSFSSPVKVGTYFDLPDCFTYTGQDLFRACVPTAPLSGASVFRAANYPSGVALSNNRIEVDYGSYVNRHSNQPILGNCAPAGLNPTTGLNLYTGVGQVNGCNNDIIRSTSTNAGAAFNGTGTDVQSMPVISQEGAQLSDQWWQWTAKYRGRALTSYYDRQYGDDTATGFMDMTLFLDNTDNEHIRVTDSSMPPGNDFPDSEGYSTFFGDYSGLAVGSDGVAHPVWMDNRNPIYSFDTTPGGDPRPLILVGFGADIYTANIGI